MQSIYYTVGPSQLYPTYTTHLIDAMNLQLGSISHRSAQFRKIYQHTDEQLRILLNIPATHSIFFLPSATEIWERMILNTIEKKSFHFVQGAFSKKFYDFANILGKQTQLFETQHGKSFDDISTTTIDDDVELICVTQNETASGIQIPEEEIHALKNNHVEKLICVDLVSTAPYANMNYNLIDSSFFSVQKAFGMAAGLGVWICNEACIEKSNQLSSKNINQGAHHTLQLFQKNYATFETPSTPNVVAIYILGKIAEDMNKVGVEQIRKEIDKKAELLYTLGTTSNLFSFSENDKVKLSKTTSVFNTTIESSIIMEALKKENIIIGSGYGQYKAEQIRIANFPATILEQMEKLTERLMKF
jgi:phosphoserine aminotransferase